MSARLAQESVEPTAFDHNAVLLEVADIFEDAKLAPEFVPAGQSRTPDLILRISATRTIELDVKAPRALQLQREGGIEAVEPRRTIRQALTKSRGQFRTPGILVIAGDVWIGGLDAYADAAAALLSTPLPDDASVDARMHYKRLLGVLLVARGYDLKDRQYQSRLFARWIPSSRYADDIELILPPKFDGPFSIGFKPAGAATDTSEQSFESEPPVGAAFRVRGDEVQAEGRIVRTDIADASQPLAAFEFPPMARPMTTRRFDLACEAGFTTGEVRPDGQFLLRPDVGWVDLHGTRFKLGE